MGFFKKKKNILPPAEDHIEANLANSTVYVRDLQKIYPSAKGDVQAMKDVNINVMENEFVSIVGPSGCGKSTLLRMIGGLDTATSGKIVIQDRDIIGPGADRGMVFQSYTLFPWMTVGDNIKFGLKLRKIPANQQEGILNKYLKIIRLEKFRDRYPRELSGGMKQRVMIAIALVGSPSIVIADEPTTSLDVTIEAQILDVLKNLQKTLGTSIILITHDLGVIAKLCDRVLVMYGGKIVERGSVDEIFYDTAHPYTKGLMHSIAKLDTAKGHKLQPIEGTPPDLFAPPKGCPFAARCEYCMEICKDMPPQTYELSKEHETCCWLQHEYAPDTDMRRKVTEKGEV